MIWSTVFNLTLILLLPGSLHRTKSGDHDPGTVEAGSFLKRTRMSTFFRRPTRVGCWYEVLRVTLSLRGRVWEPLNWTFDIGVKSKPSFTHRLLYRNKQIHGIKDLIREIPNNSNNFNSTEKDVTSYRNMGRGTGSDQSITSSCRSITL